MGFFYGYSSDLSYLLFKTYSRLTQTSRRFLSFEIVIQKLNKMKKLKFVILPLMLCLVVILSHLQHQ